MTRARFGIVLFASLLLPLAGCSTANEPKDGDQNAALACRAKVIPNASQCTTGDCCTTDEQCVQLKTCEGESNPETFACHLPSGTCVHVDSGCDPSHDADCCPGQQCSQIVNQEGVCTDNGSVCDPADPSACTVKGQYCSDDFGSTGTGTACTFRPCEDGQCADGLACFHGFCVGEAPCDGVCASGSVCVPTNNRCYRVGPQPDPTCQQTCPAGRMLVFADSQNLFSGCDMGERSCTCAELPTFDAEE